MDINKRSIVRLTDEVKNKYAPEEESVFEERNISKIEVPKEFSNTYEYTVGRKDIDINNHMHNTYYLTLAFEALPLDVYENRPYDNIRISYKKEIPLGDTVKCEYAKQGEKHIVVISEKETYKINAIIELY